MIKLSYSYRGDPIGSYRKPYRGRKSGGKKKYLIAAAIVIIAGLIVFFSSGKDDANESENEAVAEEQVTEVVEQKAVKTPTIEKKAVQEAPKTEDKTAPAPQVTAEKKENGKTFKPVTGSTAEKMTRLCDKAQKYLDAGKYAEARSLVTPLFSVVSPYDPIYERAQGILSRASMQIYSKGGETPIEYTVKSGDNLSLIAKKYSTSVDAIQRLNGMSPKDTALKINQKLKIPSGSWKLKIDRDAAKMFLYEGDKLFKIYSFGAGEAVPAVKTGNYRIAEKIDSPVWNEDGKSYKNDDKHNVYGARLLGLLKTSEPKGTNFVVSIHGSNMADPISGPAEGKGYFRLSNSDAKELFTLLPVGTPVEVTR